MRARRLLLPVLLVWAALAGAGCDSTPSGPEPGANVGALIEETADLQVLASALEQTGLAAELAGAGPYTVFAPTDLAFTYLGQETVQALTAPAHRDALRRILRRHIVPGRWTSAALARDTALTPLEGPPLPVTHQGPTLLVGGVPVARADLEAANGVVQSSTGSSATTSRSPSASPSRRGRSGSPTSCSGPAACPGWPRRPR